MFSENLKKLRTDFKLSQEELGLILGYSRTAISAYELGRNEPSFEDLKKIANYFSVTTDFLLSIEKNKPTITDEILTTEQKKIINVTKGFSHDELKNIIDYANFIKSKRNN